MRLRGAPFAGVTAVAAFEGQCGPKSWWLRYGGTRSRGRVSSTTSSRFGRRRLRRGFPTFSRFRSRRCDRRSRAHAHVRREELMVARPWTLAWARARSAFFRSVSASAALGNRP